ncbi:MAG: PP2C family protein-serine/threonine phosphatase, partial [Gemmataceae bacterium]
LALVADGMGGHADGDRAAALAVGAVARALLPRLADVVAGAETPSADVLAEWLDHALWDANRAILRAGGAGSAGMGATAVAALAFDAQAAVCHVGDCRTYRLRGGALERLTADQTLLRRMIELGQITPAEAAGHRAAHQVSQALGRAYGLEPERRALTVEPGDVLLLACDGVHGQLGDDAIRAALAGPDAAALLVRQADDAGGKDNSTAVVLRRGEPAGRPR